MQLQNYNLLSINLDIVFKKKKKAIATLAYTTLKKHSVEKFCYQNHVDNYVSKIM